ncbi:DUF624 domain-containing protein [Marinilactibacillus kalidii]|uniref:DUF624 domain-containing protein n=1 Tax=Marinilactibacillus kalidii TaxID=2820274 RepID=UPI001ABE0EC6|nr:DUF624 domain-containing protein [Marinilactibacillus kalidii]
MEKEKNLSKQTSMIVQATEWFADLALLNLLWLLFSIPILTLIPATESLFYVIFRLYKKEEKHPLKLFVRHFKENMWTSIKRNSYILIVYIVFGLNYLLISSSIEIPVWMHVFATSLAILFVLFTISCFYYFTIMQQITIDMKKRWLLAFFLMVKLFPKTLLFVFLTSIVWLLVFLWPSTGLFFSMSLPVLFSTIIIEKILSY